MEKEKTIIGINASFARKPNTGIGQVTLNFLRKLSEYEVGSSKYKAKYKFILYLEEDLPAYFKLPENFEKRIFLPSWKRDDLIRKIWWEKYMLPRQAKKDACDIFISLYQRPSIYQYMEMQHIMVVHDIVPELFPEYLNNIRKKIYWRLTKSGIKRADKIIAVSKRTEKDLIEKLGIDAQKISVDYIDVDEIYKNKVSTDTSVRVLKKYKLKPGYILAGGGYEVRKNVEGAIRAYKLLLERNKKERFILNFPKLAIFGKLLPQLAPLTTDAEKLTKELNLTKHVDLLGLVSQKDMPAIIQNASRFVYPSFYEGFGMPVLEAMNSGIPVIASKTSSLPEVGGDGVLYCNPDYIDDIAMVMKNLMGKHELRETLKQRGLERAKMFSWDKFTEKILNIISESFS
jgi:glycosyltransferase involved in cell wall biosynthesis